MVTIKHKGNFKKLDKYFNKSLKIKKNVNLNTIAENCISNLKNATPKDSGLTADSWSYKIIKTKNSSVIEFSNSNIQNGTNVVMLIEYGHVSNSGSWVEGQHFVDPIIREAYNKILNETWKEIKEL